jgi:hypothetical protein
MLLLYYYFDSLTHIKILYIFVFIILKSLFSPQYGSTAFFWLTWHYFPISYDFLTFWTGASWKEKMNLLNKLLSLTTKLFHSSNDFFNAIYLFILPNRRKNQGKKGPVKRDNSLPNPSIFNYQSSITFTFISIYNSTDEQSIIKDSRIFIYFLFLSSKCKKKYQEDKNVLLFKAVDSSKTTKRILCPLHWHWIPLP